MYAVQIFFKSPKTKYLVLVFRGFYFRNDPGNQSWYSQNFKKLNIWGNEKKRKAIGDARN